jgi:hypothetical protein
MHSLHVNFAYVSTSPFPGKKITHLYGASHGFPHVAPQYACDIKAFHQIIFCLFCSVSQKLVKITEPPAFPFLVFASQQFGALHPILDA